VVAAMQQVADRFTDGFRAHTADWHMMQRVFVADLDRGRTSSADGDGG
jgi:KDO2-lipid IV(A) lauroyltransferase